MIHLDQTYRRNFTIFIISILRILLIRNRNSNKFLSSKKYFILHVIIIATILHVGCLSKMTNRDGKPWTRLWIRYTANFNRYLINRARSKQISFHSLPRRLYSNRLKLKPIVSSIRIFAPRLTLSLSLLLW